MWNHNWIDAEIIFEEVVNTMVKDKVFAKYFQFLINNTSCVSGS